MVAIVILTLVAAGCGGSGNHASQVADAIRSGTAGGLGSLGSVTNASCQRDESLKGEQYRCTASTGEGVAQLVCFPDETSAGGSFCAITARP
ncbi:unannotated protein [freshwater metagenome]|uniref:Unannotated protein n=1 Tax=freshwater metagenome TaxID=449393 RepID=A0A6J6P8W8_9ZZZZ